MDLMRFLGRRLCRRSLSQLTILSVSITVAVCLYFGGLYPFATKTGLSDTFSWSIDSKKLKNVFCVHPRLELWNDRLRQLFTAPTPLTCSKVEKNWVYITNATFYISDEAVRRHGRVTCDYIPVHRGKDDFEVMQGDAIKAMPNGTAITSDVFRVKCTGMDGQMYNNIYPAITPNDQLFDRGRKLARLLPATALKLNIIIFGFDSVSRMTWMRNLPKSYEYLVNTLQAVIMEGYNVVGDGTPQALLPMLTGFAEPELPEARRGFEGAKTVDDHPWIWKMLKEVGYVTQWGEESPAIGTFTYRMLGFRNQPVDYYLRTFYLAAEQQYKLHEPYCLGSTPRHNLMLQWTRQFLDTYKDQLKFSFVFHSEYSHEANSNLQWADDDLLEFLRYINDHGHLDRSLLVLMSDHGARFQNVRVTEQGKYEERLPFLALRVPRWLSRRNPELVENLRANADKLTTPFDLHATLLDVVDFRSNSTAASAQHVQRGTSLFSAISSARTCADAGVEPHWCACLQWQPVSIGSEMVRRAANEVLLLINGLTKTQSTHCARLTLASIDAAVKYVAGSDLLRFRQSVDIHGRQADLSDDMKPTVEFYQITFSVEPSKALYEATVKHQVLNTDDGEFSVDVHDISRINRYGSQPNCIADRFPHLRPYCYCTRR